ncbi:ribosome silencing factor [Flavilitoribacter nigricans DSM 23189 = NBRC 102662]|uniref:Ribosomal silencing factor RsfS n=1 Tax=Flavilitoribacter nigricans (strain ATCC 23147 / DSM 23189 / NBRC 102662 / NCIMB 1420 / SS-2) TaxID=1122177 RepID=A0A2D0NI62_FLAN2|nr:ribosome silencing factor [Flavilitoribacter nigricans DSM 23189 = NBRC 102662]
MNLQVKLKQPSVDTRELNELVIDSIHDIKGKNVVKLDLRHLEEAPTDYFIICEGDSNTQVKAIADNIYRRIKDEMGILPNHTEGQRESLWICIDYFTTVVHIFYREKRGFYDLENLWSDAKFVEYETL